MARHASVNYISRKMFVWHVSAQLRSDRVLVVLALPDATEQLQQLDAKIAELEQTTPEQILQALLK